MEWLWLSLIYGVALAMDCLALSITDGLVYQDLNKKKDFFIAGVFSIGQGVFPLLGFLLGEAFSKQIDEYDHWIGFVLLLLIGLRMLFEGAKGIIRPEQRKPRSFSRKEVVIQGVADSIDALAVGITIRTNIHATADYQVYAAFAIIALVTFGVSLLGLFAGKGINRLLKGKYEISEAIGGIVLIVLGTLILCEGLGAIYF
jgi:manganese efflux pump family protein